MQKIKMARKFTFFIFLLLCSVVNAQEKWSRTGVEDFQRTLNSEYIDPKESPLMKSDLATFKTLDFFPINEEFAVSARLVKSTNEKAFQMKTSTARLPIYKKYGELHFVLKGKAFVLNVYQNQDLIKTPGYEKNLFLPFSDLTCGKESYIGGRYIDMKIPESDTILIDFNTAYNPYCAYNHMYSCPLVPMENDLNIAIEAGVKKFHD